MQQDRERILRATPQFQAKIAEEFASLDEGMEKIRKKVETPEAGKTFARALFGADFKVTTLPNGQIQQTDWTWADIHTEMDRMRETDERNTRSALSEELFFAMDAQEGFFIRTEHPLVHDAVAISEFTGTLLHRVLSSKASITDTWPAYPLDEAVYGAEALEVVRRTVLKPAYQVVSGTAEGPIDSIPSYNEQRDFWDTIDNDEDTKQDFKTFFAERRKKAHENPAQYTDSEWVDILQKEKQFCLEYIQEAARRSVDMPSADHFIMFLEELRGSSLPTDVTDGFRDSETEQQTLVNRVLNVKDFMDLLPFIKEVLGEDATYQTLLQKLHPLKELANPQQ